MSLSLSLCLALLICIIIHSLLLFLVFVFTEMAGGWFPPISPDRLTTLHRVDPVQTAASGMKTIHLNLLSIRQLVDGGRRRCLKEGVEGGQGGGVLYYCY